MKSSSSLDLSFYKSTIDYQTLIKALSTLLLMLSCLLWLNTSIAETSDNESFFDETFNDLTEELATAKDEEKKAILLMFEMDECPFCHRMKQTILNQPEVLAYYREHFRIISVDIEGDLELVDFSGKTTTQKDFSLKQHRVRATPVFLFFDLEGKAMKNGRFTGASKDAEEFLQLGQFIVGGHHQKMPFIKYKREQQVNKK